VFAFTVRRLFIAIPVILVSTFITFLLVTFSGDPLADLKSKNPPPPPSIIHLREHELRLDQPLLERYWHWLTGLLHGQWGPSVHNVNIGHEIFIRLGVTFRLVLLAMIVAALLAVVIGVVSAVKQYSITDYSFTFFGFLGLSLPVFWFAILLKQAGIKINEAVGHVVFYTIGSSSIDVTGGVWAHFTDSLGHLVLPTITLAITQYAAWSRYTRASMLDVLGSDYVRLARAADRTHPLGDGDGTRPGRHPLGRDRDRDGVPVARYGRLPAHRDPLQGRLRRACVAAHR
jgi:peptide/nickel transport system permease protein